MSWIMDPDGGQICPDCATDQCLAGPPCDRHGCHCGLCGQRRDHIAAAADRPDGTLQSLARDMQQERLPTLDELQQERHGDLRRLMLERYRRSA